MLPPAFRRGLRSHPTSASAKSGIWAAETLLGYDAERGGEVGWERDGERESFSTTRTKMPPFGETGYANSLMLRFRWNLLSM